MKLPAVFFLLLSFLACSAQTVSVDKNIQYQTIEGFGAFGGNKPWWEPGPHFDEAFLTKTIDDLGMTFFRTQIYWDGESENDNDDPNVLNMAGFDFGPTSDNGKQFPFITALAAKGAKLLATVWTPPIWMKLRDDQERIPDECYNCYQCPNGSAGTEMCGGRLNPEHYDEYAEYLVAYVKTLKQETGVDLYGISIQNEPFFANPFESNVVLPEEYADILKAVAERFNAEGITTKFFGPEHMAEWSWGWQQKYVQETLGDPSVKPHLDIYAVHSYVDGVAPDYGSAEGWTSLHDNITVAHGKPLWMTETSDFNTTGFDLGLSMAKSLYLAMRFGHISGWVYWSIHDAIVKNNQLTPLGYAFKNYYRYVRPGTVRIETNSSDASILPLAFLHPQTNEFTLVLINQGTASLNVDLSIPFEHGELTLYRTSATENCKDMGVYGLESITLPPKSISTLSTITGSGVTPVEKKKGARVNVFPNPTDATVVVEYEVSAPSRTLRVLDQLGRPVLERFSHTQDRYEIDTSGMKGVYFLEVGEGSEKSIHKIVVK